MAAKKQSSKNKSELESGLESAFAARTADLEKGTKEYNLQLKILEKQLKLQEDISKQIAINKKLSDEQKGILDDAQKKYVAHQKLQASLAQQVKDRVITEEQAKKVLNKSRAEFDSIVRSAKLTNKEAKALKTQMQGLSKEMQLSADGFQKTAQKAQLLNAAIDQIGSSGIPLMQQFGDVLKNVIQRNAEGARIAMTALGAAAAILYDKYYNAGDNARIKADLDRQKNNIDAETDIAKIENKRLSIGKRRNIESRQININAANEVGKIEARTGHLKQTIGMSVSQNSIDTANTVNQLTIEAANASKRAAIQFSSQMQSSAAEFSAASKTALYGKGVGSIGYGAGQMQLAGVGAENVAASLTTASKALGGNISSDVAADMALLEKRTGQSSENISGMVSFFKRMNKVSAGTALNMVEGMRAMADSANIDLGGLMEEVAQASKEALGYQIKSGPALAKQVAYAQSLGVSFNDVAKAGKSMVLNYKDSIKKEMELSAMLGRNVNLSEARALFSQGKTDDALKSIKAQGLDPNAMNMFQQEALSQALGGLDLDTLQKVATGTGKNATLGTGNVKSGNQQFLSTTQSAQSTLAAQQASISAQTAIVDAKLSGKITDAYLNSPGYLEYQKNLLQQQKNQTQLDASIEQSYLASKAYNTFQQETLNQERMNVALLNDEINRFIMSDKGIELAAKDAQFGIDRMIEENKRTAMYGAGGAIVGNLLGKGLEMGMSKLFGKSSPMPVTIVGAGPLDKLKDLAGDKIGNKLTDKVKNWFTKKGSEKIATKTTEKAVAKGVTKATTKAATKTAEKVAVKATEKIVAKTAIKSLAKSGSKMLMKRIPILGSIMGMGFAIDRAMSGDWTGAGLETLSAGAGLIDLVAPGAGTAASMAIDAGIAARDMGAFGGATASSAAASVKAGKVPVPSKVTPGAAGVPAKPSLVLNDVQYQTRLQTEMVALLGMSTGFMKQLLEVSAAEFDRPININGTKLNSNLLSAARKNYAVARREAVGAYKAP